MFDYRDASGLLVFDDINPASDTYDEPNPEDFDEDFGWSRDYKGRWTNERHAVSVETDRETGDRYTVVRAVGPWFRREVVRTLLDLELALAVADEIDRRERFIDPLPSVARRARRLREAWREMAVHADRVFCDAYGYRRHDPENVEFPPPRRAPARPAMVEAVPLALAAE